MPVDVDPDEQASHGNESALVPAGRSVATGADTTHVSGTVATNEEMDVAVELISRYVIVLAMVPRVITV
jgi:hypothetical protein